MLRFMVEDLDAEPSRRVFIPHYRERVRYRGSLPDGVRFVDIDSPPLELAKEIQRSEVVYSSSLHGLVFAHALERPAVLVHPQTQEPLTKYEDYHLGAGLPWRSPALDIFEALRPPPPTSPVTLTYEADDFALPSLAELRDHGVVE
ncbi:MAG: polysaccharide pyruvyl transferase family protein [Acidimicrobiales bacterium]|nr:polysaccharide pyruvyl transferase family protein [Acidimicrobiales bacterium]